MYRVQHGYHLRPRVRDESQQGGKGKESGANVSGLRGGNNSRILRAHPSRPVAFRQLKRCPVGRKVLPGNVRLDRKAVLCCHPLREGLT